MKEKRQFVLEDLGEGESTYFTVQAYAGTTKHMGGQRSTLELIELCALEGEHYVLDVGCGVGATACYLAKHIGCRVMGVDVSPRMVERAEERARREGVTERVGLRVADVRRLPFSDAEFDVVLVESVLVFIAEKATALGEVVRVVKPGGCVGCNEETWLKSPPPARLVEFAARTWEITAEIPTSEGWVRLLEDAGLSDVVAQPHRAETGRESSQLQRYTWRDMLGMAWRYVSLHARSPAFRRYMKGRMAVPEGLFDYLGYGLYAGRKAAK